MARYIECDICRKRFDIDETMSEGTLISADLLSEHCHLPETRLELCDKCYSDLKQYIDSLVKPGLKGALQEAAIYRLQEGRK